MNSLDARLSPAEPLAWQAPQWNTLSAARAAGRLPHALLLRGAAGLGKGLFARRLAASLLCTNPGTDGAACRDCPACHLVDAGSHPDLHRLAPEEPGRAIKIDAVRALVAKSVLSAQPDSYRVFIIEPAEAMNRSAANALLKTLEEPARRTVMLLVSANPDRLPATVRSRCQQITFNTPPAAQALAWLETKLTSTEDPAALLRIAGGRPLRAMTAAEEDWLAKDALLAADLAQLKRRAVNPIQLVEKWEEWPLPLLIAGLKRLAADLVKVAAGIAQGDLRHSGLRPELQDLCDGIDLRQVFVFFDQLLGSERAALHNANVQMTLEHIMNCWLQLTRQGGR